jgi:2-methylisocitrate lyase-like PEP mutase family enzyme
MTNYRNRREFIKRGGLAAAAWMAAAQPSSGATAGPVQGAAPKTSGARFRELLRGQPVEGVGVYSVPTARMAEILGFPVLWLGSTAYSELHGVPDWNLVSDAELVDYLWRITDSVAIPLLVDLDISGFTPVHTYRFTKAYERAGVGAIHLTEIEPWPGGKRQSIKEVSDRIRAAVDARSEMVVTARTDVMEGVAKAIERGVAYKEAGAEALWILPGFTEEQSRQISAAAKIPIIASIGTTDNQGRYNAGMSAEQIRQGNIQMTLLTTFVRDIARRVEYNALRELKNTRSGNANLVPDIPMDIRRKLIDIDQYDKLARQYLAK